jgi:transcriptional regulator with XRE-family HTH domain
MCRRVVASTRSRRRAAETPGLTRSAFAERLGILRDSVSRYELGRHVLSVEVLVKTAQAGGITVDGRLTGANGDPRLPSPGPGDSVATVAALSELWRDPAQRAAVRAALEAWVRGVHPSSDWGRLAVWVRQKAGQPRPRDADRDPGESPG